MAGKKGRSGSAKLARSEIVQVRLDPKLRMAAELAAGKERRTLSSFTEWAIGEAVKRIDIAHTKEGSAVSAAAVAELVWDVDEADRFVKLARRFPALLTHAEQRKWKFIQESPEFWRPGDAVIDGEEWVAVDNLSPEPNLQVIRLCWGLINEHIEERSPFDWNSFANYTDDAYPHVKVYYPQAGKKGETNGP